MKPSAPPAACLIIIGNEILSGRTQDENLVIIGQRCDAWGIDLNEVRIIPDDEEAIIKAVNTCRAIFSYVFTTGGIGPTHDDITAASVAKAFGVKLASNSEAVAALSRYYEADQLTEARLKMTQIPAGASLIDNPISGAPGFQLDNVLVLPGVPMILEAMLDGSADRLTGGAPILTESVATNLAESVIASDLGALQRLCPDVAMGSYPYFKGGKLGLNLVLRARDEARMQDAARRLREIIANLNGEVLNAE